MKTWAWLLLPLIGCVSDWTLQDRDGDGFTVVQGDCDDDEPRVHPGAVEACDALDNDCSGQVDDLEEGSTEPGAEVLYYDRDDDGYGLEYAETRCADPDQRLGLVDNNLDCDDSNVDLRPDALEWCDGVDNDCDGVVDPATSQDTLEWWPDADQDGYGDAAATSQLACDAPVDADGRTWTDNALDCDDGDPTTNPGAPEVCDDDIDHDCDGDPSTACR